MANPKLLHTDIVLSNLSVLLGTGSFAAAAALPVIPVEHESDKYTIFGNEHISDDVELLRAAGAAAPEIDFKTTQGTYSAKEYSVRGIVTDRARANADPPIEPFRALTRILQARIFLAWEKRAKALLTTTGNFGTNNAAIGTGWGDTVNGDPEQDCDTAKEGIEVKSGYVANTIIIPPAKARVLKKHPKVRALVQYTNPSLLVNGDLPPILWNLRVVIPSAIENTANPGQSASIARIWNNTSAQVLYVDPNPGLETQTWGASFRVRTFGVAGQRVKRWRDEDRDGEKVEYGLLQDEAVISTGCGAIITGI